MAPPRRAGRRDSKRPRSVAMLDRMPVASIPPVSQGAGLRRSDSDATRVPETIPKTRATHDLHRKPVGLGEKASFFFAHPVASVVNPVTCRANLRTCVRVRATVDPPLETPK